MFNRINKGMYWDKAWKLVEGCTPVSEGCAHCWSARETHMRAKNPNAAIAKRNKGLTKISPLPSGGEVDYRRVRGCCFNGKIRLRLDNLELPLRTKNPTVWAIWNDLFHPSVDIGFLTRVYDMMDECERHTFLVLTKRPERIVPMLYGKPGKGWRYMTEGDSLDNVWHGTTAENQAAADYRIPQLLKVPGKLYVSIEPMLGPVDISKSLPHNPRLFSERNGHKSVIDWVICGGESGPGARPMHPDWARSLRDQCQAAGVPFFFKQWGEWYPDKKIITRNSRCLIFGDTVVHRVGKKAAGRILDGKEWLQLPEVVRR